MTQRPPKRQRSCIGCQRQDAQAALHRFVRSADGVVSFDEGGKAPGRGAYVCSAECFRKARKTGRLGRALRVSLTEADYDRIAGELATALAAPATKDEE